MLRDYVFYDSTRSLCSRCLAPCDAKIIVKNGSAYLLKRCPEHGEHLELLEEDASYLDVRHRYDKPGNRIRPDVPASDGCPFDCGLCPDHEQHTCTALIEITQDCDLGCPVCYAESGEGTSADAPSARLPLDRIEAMMDFCIAAEGGRAEILQVSGGEPTVHPDIEAILTLAKRKKFSYLMLNTNGLRLAEDPAFCEFLASLTPGFEVYLQFDGMTEKPCRRLRGRDLLDRKMQAIANLQSARVPMTLVMTVVRGLNDSQIGDVIRFGMEQDCIRGVNFQPVAYFGRGEAGDVANRSTLSGIRRDIERQTAGLFAAEDVIPLPCDVHRVAVTYAVKRDDDWVPVTSRVKIEGYLELIDNTMDFRAEDLVRNSVARAVTKGIGCDCLKLKDLLTDILPKGYVRWSSTERARFIDANTFRITISSFVDARNFDAVSMKKECVHVITPDLRRIPFSAYNMVHRG